MYSPVLLILLTAILGLLIAPDKSLAFNRLLMLAIGVIAFFIVAWWARRKGSLVKLGSLLLLVGVAAALLSLVSTDWSAGELTFPMPLSERFSALLRLPGSGVPNWADGINPRLVAGTMALFLPLAISLALFARRPALRWLGGLSGLVMLFPLCLSQSPQGLLALVLGLVMVLVWRWPRSLFLLGGITLLAIIAWYFWHWGLSDDLAARLLVGVQARLDIWPVALRMLRDMPFTGIGLNNLPVVQPLYDFTLSLQPHAHNVFLQTALDQGVIGLTAFLILFAIAFLAGWHAYRRLGDSDYRAIVLGCAGGSATFLSFGIWDCMTLGHKPAVAVWVMLGLMIAAGGVAGWMLKAPAWFTLKRVVWLLGGMGLLAAVSVTLWGSALLVNAGRVLYNPLALSGGQVDEQRLAKVHWLVDTAARFYPRNGPANLLSGYVDIFTGDDTSAAQVLKAGLALDPGDRYAHLALADACLRMDDIDCALDHWQLAEAYQVLLSRGQALYQAKDYVGARVWFSRAVGVDPSPSNGWLRLGNSYNAAGEAQTAKAVYEEILTRFPTLSAGYEGLASILLHLNQPEQAAQVLEQGFKLAQPPGADLYYQRSRLAATVQDYASAERDARQAITLQPNSGGYLAWLGDIFQRQGRYDESLAQYALTAQVASSPSWIWQAAQHSGSVYAAQGLWEQAIADYGQAVEMSQAQGVTSDILAQNYSALGNILLQSGNMVEAETAFRQALQLDPLNTAAYKGLEALGGR
jgi:tetratricopeptide (TPR) repeat protein